MSENNDDHNNAPKRYHVVHIGTGVRQKALLFPYLSALIAADFETAAGRVNVGAIGMVTDDACDQDSPQQDHGTIMDALLALCDDAPVHPDDDGSRRDINSFMTAIVRAAEELEYPAECILPREEKTYPARLDKSLNRPLPKQKILAAERRHNKDLRFIQRYHP